MRPPKGFEHEKYPLIHTLKAGYALSLGADTNNTAFVPIVMSSTDMAGSPSTIVVNPHNTNYVSDIGPLCRQMSIIDRMTISLKFQMTANCENLRETAAATFTGDSINSFSFLWRPIFNVFPEKLDAADDDTGTTVAAILGLTKDATFEDVVPITTNKLPATGPSELPLPMSTVNDVQVITDFNMSTNTAMEDHVFDEDLLQTALKRYTNKGALRSCLGRTRHVTLSRKNPFKNFYLDKFVPRAIRRVQPYGFFGIQVHMHIESNVKQHFLSLGPSDLGHLGVKMLVNYHEWNFEHDQDMNP